MYQLKTNEKSSTVFRFGNVKDFDHGYFYEDKKGNRFLTFYDYACDARYGVCISSNETPTKVGDYLGKYAQVQWRLVEPGTEFTFIQSEPIPF